MNRGYVWLWRKIEDSEVFADPHLLQLFLWCLIRATHKTRTVSVNTGRGKTVVPLKPGQFIFGRNSAARALDCPPSSVRNRIESLRKRKMLDIKEDTHFSVVTIANWNTYQSDAMELGQASGQASGQPKDTNKNVKNFQEQQHTPCASPQTPGESRSVSEKGKRKESKATTATNPDAVELYEWYAENIVDDPTGRMEAIQNITALLEQGHRLKHLTEAMNGYIESIPYNAKPRYLTRAKNFFGPKKGYAGFPPYLGGNGEPILDDSKPSRPPFPELQENVGEILKQREGHQPSDVRLIFPIAVQLSKTISGDLDLAVSYSMLRDRHGLDDWTADLLFAAATLKPNFAGMTN